MSRYLGDGVTKALQALRFALEGDKALDEPLFFVKGFREEPLERARAALGLA